ncbi:MAG TPA: hypothetical protein VKP30_05410 [Polyangiaceae bacterium]|nr:hypothetical protein [Polyangiaceae bacterium]
MTLANISQQHFIALRHSIRVTTWTSLLLLGAWTGVAYAEEDAADVAGARELAIEGLKLADAGHCFSAIDKLSRSEKLHHAPIVLGRLGECLISEGKIVEGTEALRRLLREQVPANAPPALLKARERAQIALDAAKPKIGSLVLSVREPPEGVVVLLDQQPVPPALFERSRPTDPGDHTIDVSAPGYIRQTRQLALAPGEKLELSFKLVVDPQAPVAKPQPPSTDAPPSAPSRSEQKMLVRTGREHEAPLASSEESSPNLTPSYVLWGVGAAAAAAGGVFGFLAVKNKGDLDQECADNRCPPSSKDKLDGANRDALISTVLVGAGAAALVTGTVLYFVSGPNQEQPSASTSASIRPLLGIGSVGLSGRF